MVSILFADLAGFTERSDRADPEDVRLTLRPFHAAAKEEIERFGGTLDKFIGDAVMGVFGAPVAHEDDPERAVRAALSLQARIRQANDAHGGTGLGVRAAVNTGEAVVTFATGPQIGENVAGDVVNTASRLQSAAPLGAVVVGETTYRATRWAVEYEELEPVSVKGKAKPLRVWVASSVRRTVGQREEEGLVPLVGREAERHLLQDLHARSARDRSVHLVTVVGEPGIGKTRLVVDLLESVERDPEGSRWLRGRCLPYGEGVTFWALGEMVKATAGIMESDPKEVAEARLTAAVERLQERPADRDWLRARLAPLVGLGEAGPDAPTVDRAESFAAWLQFLEAQATDHTLVLVFEDLHWADQAMLDFVEHAVDNMAQVAGLVVVTARPELFDVRPSWGGGKRNATTISLPRLSQHEVAELLGSLAVRTILPPEEGRRLAASAGGNPLYARELVRMLTDRRTMEGAVTGSGSAVSAGSVPMPDSIQSLIAARLDLLTPSQRSVLQDAAVAGEVFWSGALASMAEGREDPAASVRQLEQRDMIQRAAWSSMEGQVEYRFTHQLIQEVAYRQIPRAGRARRHLAAARWIEATAGGRIADRAELLAHHYVRGLELLRAGGHRTIESPPGVEGAGPERGGMVEEGIPALEDAARRSLTAAGDNAIALDFVRATSFYQDALELAPPGHPARPDLLVRWTSAAWRSDRVSHAEAQAAYEEAAEEFLRAGNGLRAGEAMHKLSTQLGFQGETRRSRETLRRALDLLEPEGPSAALARAYVSAADLEMFSGHSQESLDWAEKALSLAGLPGTEEVAVNARHIRGNARLEMGDLAAGIDDLRSALSIGEDMGSAPSIVISHDYLGEWLWLTEGPELGLRTLRAGIEVATRRGLIWHATWGRASSLWMLFDAGLWDRLLEEGEDLLAWEERKGEGQVGAIVLPCSARVLLHRGRIDEAAPLAARALPRARDIEDLQILAPALAVGAMVQRAQGHLPEAVGLVEEFDAVTRGAPAEYREAHFPDVIRVLLAASETQRAGELLGEPRVWAARQANSVVTARALVAEARGKAEEALELFADAAERWLAYGHLLERGLALLGQARSAEALGLPSGQDRLRAEARRILDSLGIPPAHAS